MALFMDSHALYDKEGNLNQKYDFSYISVSLHVKTSDNKFQNHVF